MQEAAGVDCENVSLIEVCFREQSSPRLLSGHYTGNNYYMHGSGMYLPAGIFSPGIPISSRAIFSTDSQGLRAQILTPQRVVPGRFSFAFNFEENGVEYWEGYLSRTQDDIITKSLAVMVRVPLLNGDDYHVSSDVDSLRRAARSLDQFSPHFVPCVNRLDDPLDERAFH